MFLVPVLNWFLLKQKNAVQSWKERHFNQTSGRLPTSLGAVVLPYCVAVYFFNKSDVCSLS